MAVTVKAIITHAPTHLVLLLNPAIQSNLLTVLKLECQAYFLSLSLASSGSSRPQSLSCFTLIVRGLWVGGSGLPQSFL